jgi:ethanolamine ammonia-lyase large subunit
MISRRRFLGATSAAVAFSSVGRSLHLGFCADESQKAAPIGEPKSREDVFSFVTRTAGQFDRRLYFQVLGAANEFKEGDQSVGVAAVDDPSRINARRMLAETPLAMIDAHPLIEVCSDN